MTNRGAVCVIDDDDGVRKLVHAVLATSGYTVIEATDGKEALTIFQNDSARFDMVLTDVVMPGLSGPQLAQKMCLTHPGMQVLFMSGYTDEALGQHGVLEEGIALLEKPFTRGSLLRKLREILDPVKSSSQVEAR